MIAAIVRWSLGNRLVVVLGVIMLAIVGVQGWRSLPIDAVPDVTTVQVQVLTNAPGLAPLEVEQLVTRPIEIAMTGIPGIKTIRSVSRTAVSAVTIVFEDDVDLQLARTLVDQRLPSARESIPATAGRPEIGPLTTGLGEIFHFTVAWPGHSAREVRTLFDWEIAYSLRSVPGVVEVNGWGGETRQVEVRLRTADLQAHGISQQEIENAILGGGQSAGGGAIERGGEQVVVRLDGQYRTAEQVGAVPVATRNGIPILVRDLANVREGAGFRASAATADGHGETVYGMVQMVAGGNAHALMKNVRARLDEIGKRLPKGATVEPFYDRAALVDKVIATVLRSLSEGGAIVIVVLLLFLGDLRAGLVVATTIPLAMLGAFAIMRAASISGNVMSLGAIDFGLVVDGAVVVVEGALSAMAVKKVSAREALESEGRAVGSAIAFGIFIVALVYAPILLLEGVEGKMFRPMSWTVLFALGTALVLTFTWIPVATSLLVRKGHAGEVRIVRWVRVLYDPFLRFMLPRPAIAAVLLLAAIVTGTAFAARLGAEFAPRLEEGDCAVQVTRPPSVSLTEAMEGTTAIERALRRFPEVKRVVSRTGSPDVATDVMGIDMSDVFVMLQPKPTWTTAHETDALVAAFEKELRKELPGTTFAFTQPIEMRFQELVGGLKSDVGVKIHGDDLPTLIRVATEVQRAVGRIPGAADVRAEPTSGLATATVRPDSEKLGRLGVSAAEVRAAVEALRAGRMVGLLVEGERRFEVRVRYDAVPGADAISIARTPLVIGGRTFALGDLAEVSIDEGPAQIGRENGRRRVVVESNVRGRDLGSFVADLRRELSTISLPPGYSLSITGEYENLSRAATRLAIIVPATLAVIFVLLYLAFHEVVPAALILLNVPVAATGGILALASRGMPLSISAGVGFVALFGVATLDGVVLLGAARSREREGLSPRDAAEAASRERLRPVLTTAVVAALGFLPMAIARGQGAEVQRPLATVVIGGLVSATALTLGVLPILYAWARSSKHLAHTNGAIR